MPSACYEFGPFHLNPVKRVLRRDGLVLPLPPKTFDTLLVLIECRDQVIDKDELLNRVWGGRFIAENNLNQKISQLRKVLGKDHQHHQYIVTIPGQGYRFVADVREVRPAGAATQEFEAATTRNTQKIKSMAVLPFNVLGAEPEDYVGLCLTDALITRLSKFIQMVVPATSIIADLADNLDHGESRGKLKIDAILEGRIRRFDRQFRLTVQLVRTSDGAILWAEQFDEALTDWLTLEDTLAEQIIKALQARL
ncbi:MAG: winged helix-turn-helix domain-containing protein [Acidobacteriota bacterium]